MMRIDQLGSNIMVYIKIPDKSLKSIAGSSMFRMIIFLSVCVLLVTTVVVLLPIRSYSQSSSNITSADNIITNNSSKVIILGFDDNRKGDFTYAKPILDKYGFKATLQMGINVLTKS